MHACAGWMVPGDDWVEEEEGCLHNGPAFCWNLWLVLNAWVMGVFLESLGVGSLPVVVAAAIPHSSLCVLFWELRYPMALLGNCHICFADSSFIFCSYVYVSTFTLTLFSVRTFSQNEDTTTSAALCECPNVPAYRTATLQYYVLIH